MRLLLGTLAASSLLLSAPAHADDKDPVWAGVWQGKVGKYPIVACLDTSWNKGDGRGSYYYLSQMKPIPLRSEEDNSVWLEKDEKWEDGAQWNWRIISASRLEGRWSDGKKSYHVSLTPMEWQNANSPYMPCEAPAFLAPRLKGGEVVLEAGDTDGIAFIKHEYRSPKSIDVSVVGFELMGDQPGDEAINKAVARYRPTGAVSDDWAECISGGLSMHGTDGYFERDVRPSLLSDQFVTVWVAGSTYCGGAHPNHFSNHLVFDRQSGEKIELDRWFDARGFADNDYGSRTITPALRNMVLSVARENPARNTPGEEGFEAECLDIASDADWWDMALTREGIIFKPELPHVATACEDPINVPWSALESWLNDAGRAGKARLE